MSPKAIIEIYTGRWSIETMFQEMRAYLGLETTRGRTRSTVLRAAPMLFGLYRLVVLLYIQMPSRWKTIEGIYWSGKSTVTFSDVITRVRCWRWAEWVFETSGEHHAFSKLPHRFRDTILHASLLPPDDAKIGKSRAQAVLKTLVLHESVCELSEHANVPVWAGRAPRMGSNNAQQ